MNSRISPTSTSRKSVEQVRLLGGEVAAGGEHREEGDERDDRERVQPREEDERDDGVAVGRVPVAADVSPQAEDVDGGGEADEEARGTGSW